ncbi:MAG: MBOAT family protein [Oscillospiraceae bacterium]|nr:MBOAT family protein [Oscillospiraceae bacterium]
MLLAGSLVFYCINAPAVWWIALPLAETALTYFAARFIAKHKKGQLAVQIITIVILFGVLLFFKYFGLFTNVRLAFPVGISFFTFMLCGYLCDAANAIIEPSGSFFDFASGVLFFPKLLAGPITDWQTVRPQLTAHYFNYETFDSGLRTFILGLGLKVLIADRLGGLWRQVNSMGFGGVSTALAWLGLIAYALQLYFDFFGYSVMAVGLGRMMGFRLPENFDFPYSSHSMSEFWRRWHITLGAWFRKYIYIPLGGNRKGLARQLLNIAVVWVCTSVWHGSTVNFLLWGLFVFIFIVLEKLTGLDRKKAPWQHAYLIIIAVISWSFFAVSDIGHLTLFLGKLFPFATSANGVFANDYIRFGARYLPYLIIGAALCFPWCRKLWDRFKATPVGTVFLFLVFWGSVYFLSIGQNDPFMYAGF